MAEDGKQRRYRVSGTDDHSGIHAFETDDRERADVVRAIMAEDLNAVELARGKRQKSRENPE